MVGWLKIATFFFRLKVHYGVVKVGEILEGQRQHTKGLSVYQEKNALDNEEMFFLSIGPKRRHFVRFPIPVTLERLSLSMDFFPHGITKKH